MQLEQQESFTIHGPQLEILGEVETKLPAPAKKRGVAACVLALCVLVSVFGIGGNALKSQYRAICDTYTATDKYGHGIQQDFDTQADAAANLIRLCEPVLGSDNDAVFSANAALDAWNTSAQENGAQPPVQYAANKQLYSAVDALYAVGSAKASGDAKRQMDTQYDAFVSAQATLERAAAAYNQQADAYNKKTAAFPANVISGLWGVGEVPSFSNTQ